jgi:hypothetical protein
MTALGNAQGHAASKKFQPCKGGTKSTSRKYLSRWHTVHTVPPLQGLMNGYDQQPRALPWAFMCRAFSPHEELRGSSAHNQRR